MKLKLLIAVTTITLFTSCFQGLYGDSKGTTVFKQNHASIEIDMSMDEVISLLGEPMNRQFKDSQETWQYCRNSLDANQFFTVSFEDKKVFGINNYSKNKSKYNGCIKCENCFKEIKFTRRSKLK